VNVIELGGDDSGGERSTRQPIVFVHGLSGSWPNWLEQLPVLGAERRVVAMDLPGFGHSPLPREEISISAYARLLDRLMHELRIDAAAVVGNSMGGFVAAELAIAFPHRVERLVLVSAAGISTNGVRTRRTLATVSRLERIASVYTAWLASRSDNVTSRPRLRGATLGMVASHPDRLPAALAAEQLRGAGTPGFLPALKALFDYDIRERLAEIACPTLVVWGDRDRVIGVRDADAFANIIPGSRKVIFEDTGHVPMLERPAEFNALLKDFLAE
jgi:pimeloyl-ACP methyl ester carboxylesterase